MDDEERPGGIEPHLQRQTTASPESQVDRLEKDFEREREGERERGSSRSLTKRPSVVGEGGGGRSCGPQITHHH